MNETMRIMLALLFVAGSTMAISMEKAVAAPAAQAQAQVQNVNINKATSEELQAVRGIGPVIAQRILDHRKANGNFQKVEDLGKVPGIGTAKLEKIKTQVTV